VSGRTKLAGGEQMRRQLGRLAGSLRSLEAAALKPYVGSTPLVHVIIAILALMVIGIDASRRFNLLGGLVGGP
jgi:hypothetical protein